MLKKASILIITIAMLLNAVSFAIAADSGIKILINDTYQNYEQKPVITKGTTLVPLRAIFETLGAKVEWDGATQTVTSKKGETEIKLTIGKTQAFKNGKSITLMVPPQIIKGSTYVPLRFVSESFGATVKWDGTTNTVTIITNKITSNINFTVDREPNLDILNAISYDDLEIINNTNEGLFRIGPSGEYQFAMAKDYQISADGLTWTFHLRDANWSDGTFVTAEDFVYGITRASQSNFSYLIDRYVSGVTAKDSKTFVINLKQPIPFLQSLLIHPNFFPIKESFVTSVGDSYGHKNGTISNGPFKVANWDTDSYANKHITFVKNEHYWDVGNVMADQITLKITNEPGDKAYLYQEGLLDMFEVKPSYIPYFKENIKDYQNHVFNVSSGIGYYLYFNSENKVLQNKNIRKAISWAINRQAIIDKIAIDNGKPLTGLLPPHVSKSSEQDFRKINGPLVGYDLQKAKEYLALGLKELKLTSLPTLNLLSSDKSSLGSHIKDGLKEIGINVTAVPMSFTELLKKQKNGEFDLTINGWGADYNHPMTFMELFTTGNSNNYGKWSSSKYDQWINQAYLAKSLDESIAPLLEAEKYLIKEEAAISPIYYAEKTFIVNPNLAGYQPQSTNPYHNWKWIFKH